jgi:hypothetical protein
VCAEGLFGDAFEHVGGLGGGLWDSGGHEGVTLQLAVLLEDGPGLLHERRLGGVCSEGMLLPFEDGADVESECPRGGEGAEAIGEKEVVGAVEEALRGVELADADEAFGRAGPVEGGGGGGTDAGVVGVGVKSAIHAEGDDDVGAEVADADHELSGDFGEGGELDFTVLVEVGVVEEFVVVDAEDVAGGGEFGAAELAELSVGFGGAAVGAGRAFGEADDGGLNATVCGEGKGTAKGEAFVVGMGDNAEQAKAHAGRAWAASGQAASG